MLLTIKSVELKRIVTFILKILHIKSHLSFQTHKKYIFL